MGHLLTTAEGFSLQSRFSLTIGPIISFSYCYVLLIWAVFFIVSSYIKYIFFKSIFSSSSYFNGKRNKKEVEIHLDPLDSIGIHFYPFRSIWIRCDLLGSIWLNSDPLNSIGTIWIHWDPLVSFGIHWRLL